MKLKTNLAGQRFGRLVVLEFSHRGIHKDNHWKCQCDCGTIKVIAQSSLRQGLTQSCGCLQKERTSTANKTHGMSETPEYGIWCGIIQRCTNPNEKIYQYYGGRGVEICQEWRESFEAFYKHVGPRPSPEHSIERIDNNKGYEPGNIKWATIDEQTRNRRSNHMIEMEGKTQCLTDWIIEKGLNIGTVVDRIRHGWDIERALNTPARPISR